MGKQINAIITAASLSIGDFNSLTMDITVERPDGSFQGFGGYCLAKPDSDKVTPDYTGTYILNMLKVTDCKDLESMVGKAIRIDLENGIIVGVGHIIKNRWFYPKREFDRLKNEFKEKK